MAQIKDTRNPDAVRRDEDLLDMQQFFLNERNAVRALNASIQRSQIESDDAREMFDAMERREKLMDRFAEVCYRTLSVTARKLRNQSALRKPS